MFDIQNYYSFILTILCFQLLPGAGTISILNATGKNGMGAGMMAVAGTLLGDFLYMLAAVLGLAAVLKMYPQVFEITQWLGVGYLCWLGWKNLSKPIEKSKATEVSTASGWHWFRQSLFICLINPKAIMFFMAFFPLFLQPGSSPTTLAAMMMHVTIISLLYQTCLVVAGNGAVRFFGKWRHSKRIATRLAGVAFIGFGIKLAAEIE